MNKENLLKACAAYGYVKVAVEDIRSAFPKLMLDWEDSDFQQFMIENELELVLPDLVFRKYERRNPNNIGDTLRRIVPSSAAEREAPG